MSKALFMAAAAGGSVAPTYVDDVFSTYLYAGNGSTQTITNGIDLAGRGGLVWVKARVSDLGNVSHALSDTERGVGQRISSNAPDGQTAGGFLDSFNSNGFTLNNGGLANYGTGTNNYASWTFRKDPKFFDVVTYTGNGSNRDIAHSLGVAPGCIMVKRTDTTGDWQVYHRSLANTEYLVLNRTAAKATGTTRWNSTTAGASTFRVGTDSSVNANGGTYVAYLFAHDTATDGLIQCGSFTTDGSNRANVNLGWEAQWLLAKDVTDDAFGWTLVDNLRAWNLNTAKYFAANSLSGEYEDNIGYPDAGGFFYSFNPSSTYVYIAIRRPNKPPTVGTRVFGATTISAAIDSGTPVTLNPEASDLWISSVQSTFEGYMVSRLVGWAYNQSTLTNAENGPGPYNFYQATQGNLSPETGWYGPTPQINWFFKRAPGVFDVVCDTGTGSAHTIAHNLGAVPELIIRKSRSGTTDWQVYCANLANTQKLVLNSTAAATTDTAAWNSTAPTASVFTVGTGAAVNTNAATYISYLFATLAGISKVGTYTGNGSSQTINCGFTTGARFVLIKRTNSTGDWFVWDTARGIVSGNDPHLSLNSSAAEVTTNDTIDPATSGFIVNQVAATNVNVNAATYIYLAIA